MDDGNKLETTITGYGGYMKILAQSNVSYGLDLVWGDLQGIYRGVQGDLFQGYITILVQVSCGSGSQARDHLCIGLVSGVAEPKSSCYSVSLKHFRVCKFMSV